MNAQQLFLESGNPSGVYYCSECRSVYRTFDLANECCVCQTCKTGKREKCRTTCEACSSIQNMESQKRFEELEKFALDKAEVAEDWEYVWYNDHMYSDIDELCEDCDGNPPEYVFSMKPVPFRSFTVDAVLDQYNEEFGFACEDFEIRDIVTGLKELKEAFDIFNTTNKDKILYYEEDRKHKVSTQNSWLEPEVDLKKTN